MVLDRFVQLILGKSLYGPNRFVVIRDEGVAKVFIVFRALKFVVPGPARKPSERRHLKN